MKTILLVLILCSALSAQTRISVSRESAIVALESQRLGLFQVSGPSGVDLWLKQETANQIQFSINARGVIEARPSNLSAKQRHELIDQLVWSLGLPARCWVNEVPTICVLDNWPAGKSSEKGIR